jgi:DNA-binding NarL/FixJ family response regulator
MKVLPTSHEHIRVLIADSNLTQSEVLHSALRRQPSMKITRCRSEVSDCLQALRSTSIDVVLLSGNSIDHDPLINALRVLHTSHPQVSFVLMLDGYDRKLVVNAMRTGARGLFDRAHQSFRALCRCIAVVHQGQFWVGTKELGYIVDAINSTPPVRVVDAKGEGLLTAREEQVVSLVADGAGNRAIAKQLGIKENTVKKSLMRIYDKLGVSNRVELVLYALTHRAVEQIATPSMPTAPSETLAMDTVDHEINSCAVSLKAN